MKKLTVIVMISILLIGLFSITSFAADLKIAMLLPGVISDQGWNMVAYNALKHVEKEFGVEISYTEKVPASDYEEIFRGYAMAGYDVILGHGFEFGDAAKKVASQFTDQYFIVTSTDIKQEPNLASFRINDAQSGFVQGAIAGLLTNTNKVGILGGMEIPPIINQQKGFKAGAHYINPDIEVVQTYTGSFHDVAKGKEMASAMIEDGVDVIAADADETNLGVVEAAKEHENIKVLGSSADVGAEYPDVVVTSLVEDFSVAFEVLVQDILNDKFEAEAFELGLNEGVVSLAPYRAFKDDISNDTIEKVDSIIEKLKAGEIDVDKYLEY